MEHVAVEDNVNEDASADGVVVLDVGIKGDATLVAKSIELSLMKELKMLSMGYRCQRAECRNSLQRSRTGQTGQTKRI